MNLSQFRLLTDENINPSVVAFLRGKQWDVLDVFEEGLSGSRDVDLLRLAYSQGRAVVTHDADFGTLAVLRGEPIVGIVLPASGTHRPGFHNQVVGGRLETGPRLAATIYPGCPPPQ